MQPAPNPYCSVLFFVNTGKSVETWLLHSNGSKEMINDGLAKGGGGGINSTKAIQVGEAPSDLALSDSPPIAPGSTPSGWHVPMMATTHHELHLSYTSYANNWLVGNESGGNWGWQQVVTEMFYQNGPYGLSSWFNSTTTQATGSYYNSPHYSTSHTNVVTFGSYGQHNEGPGYQNTVNGNSLDIFNQLMTSQNGITLVTTDDEHYQGSVSTWQNQLGGGVQVSYASQDGWSQQITGNGLMISNNVQTNSSTIITETAQLLPGYFGPDAFDFSALDNTTPSTLASNEPINLEAMFGSDSFLHLAAVVPDDVPLASVEPLVNVPLFYEL